MAFNKNDTFIARRSFITYDSTGILPVKFDKGSEYKCDESRKLVDVITGEVYDITNHVSDRWDWYFDKKGSFNPFRGTVTRVQYVSAILRYADGFDMDELFAIAEDENFGPMEKSIQKNNFSRILTDVVATGKFEMRKDGELVVGTGHNERNCTFHVVRKKVA